MITKDLNVSNIDNDEGSNGCFGMIIFNHDVPLMDAQYQKCGALENL